MSLKELLSALQSGEKSLEEVEAALSGVRPMDFATLDLDRARRRGVAEVIFGEGKTPVELAHIMEVLHQEVGRALATRVSLAAAEEVKALLSERGAERAAGLSYHAEARCLTLGPPAPIRETHGELLIISAGTSDGPIAAEAALVAAHLGQPVGRINDVGVAGLHRLLRHLDRLQSAAVIIVCAGMEGALASVVAGLVDVPVIAVPTSVGYGAHLGGLTPLLGMLTSCAAGVLVVNIDNGFGAAYAAAQINRVR